MKYLAYLLFRLFACILALLPECVSFACGRALVFFVIIILGVRKHIILFNLKACFPDLTPGQLKQRLRAFCRHMGEVVIEVVLLGHYGRRLQDRFVVQNPEVIERYLDNGKSVLVWSHHMMNVDYTNFLGSVFPLHSVYKKMSNPYFERWFLNTRSKTGAHLVGSLDYMRFLSSTNMQQEGGAAVYGIAADQSPGLSRKRTNAIFTDFFNHEIAFAAGPEVIARRYKMTMVYLRVRRVKRGFYTAELVDLEPAGSEFGARTKQAIKLLQEDITEQPAKYFWLHNRFKGLGLEVGLGENKKSGSHC